MIHTPYLNIYSLCTRSYSSCFYEIKFKQQFIRNKKLINSNQNSKERKSIKKNNTVITHTEIYLLLLTLLLNREMCQQVISRY